MDDFTKTFLNDIESDSLRSIADNPVAMMALQKILLASVYYNGVLRPGMKPDPTRNAALSLAITSTNLSNEILGQDTRAMAESVRLISAGFTKLEKFATPKQDANSGKNPAR